MRPADRFAPALRAPLAAAWVLAALSVPLAGPLVGCGDDVVTRRRPPADPPDGGTYPPLALEPGATFTWEAQLNHRGAGAADEGDAAYELSLTIDAVDDRRGESPSAITVSAAGANLFDRDWSDIRDFDPWVARLGPARSSDRVEPAPVEVVLDGFPDLPDPPTPKVLPAPETFFLDVREIDALRSAFVAAHPDQRPRIVESTEGPARWTFLYEGADTTVSTFYPEATRRREISLSYDEDGVLVSVSEVVGPDTAGEAPRATANLTRRAN
mgnify:CR=1 FL=1